MNENETPTELPQDLPPEEGTLEQREFLVSESGTNAPGGLMGNVEGDLPPMNEITDLPVMQGLPDLGELPPPSELTPSQLPSLTDSDLPVPEEFTDPNLSVDDMLSAAIAGELGDPEIVAEPVPSVASAPTFHVHFPALEEATRQRLKKVLETQQIAMAEKAWNSPAPVISQLNEYQAVFLLQAARAFGVEARGTVDCPQSLPLPSEEDIALGELLAVPEPGAKVSVEAAPSVVLPKGEKDVLLCTASELPGGVARETFGIVIAHRSIARRLFREEDMREKLEKELKAVPNRATATLPSSHFQVLLRDLLLDLRKSALSKGANSILGVKLEAFPESSTTDPQLEQLRLVAFGTAAVVEKT